jgi:hypothetical protein
MGLPLGFFENALDLETAVTNGNWPPYFHHPDHRNGTSEKSQWLISEPAELASFHLSVRSGWIQEESGWGLHMPNGAPEWLGLAQDHITLVFIAKFVSSNAPRLWHGYPADHRRSSRDIPPVQVLREWLTQRLLTPAKIRKVTKGQPCSL